MDAYTDEIPMGDETPGLSYDDGIPYEEQVAALPELPPAAEPPRDDSSGLAARISANRVYLPPESMLKGKRKRGDETDESMDEDEITYEGNDGLRPNALYLRGSPISHLPTVNIFAYARHYKLEPVGLEWIDDVSCVLVFPSASACRTAFETLRKVPDEEPDMDGCVSAKLVPVVLWPPEDRINKTLGKSEDMEGPVLVRIARVTDRKVRGAKLRSAFYQKHGMDAGKDPNAHSIGRAPENGEAIRRHRIGPLGDEEKRRQLDEELDGFLREEDEADRSPSPPPSPPSKMRSDYMTEDGREIIPVPGRSLLDRTSWIRAPLDDNDSEFPRASSRSGRRGRRGGRKQRRKESSEEPSILPPSRRRKTENGDYHVARSERPAKTLQELDNELDAFLNGKD